MRYIGRKDKLTDRLLGIAADAGVPSGRMCDLFAGTGAASLAFKKAGYAVTSCDVLYLSYVLTRAHIVVSEELPYAALLSHLGLHAGGRRPLEVVVDALNDLPDEPGFIWRHYTTEGTAGEEHQRMFFTPAVATRIDTVRRQIIRWRETELLSELEHDLLVACLVETAPFYANVSGVYAAYLKTYDPRALKPFRLQTLPLTRSAHSHTAHCGDGLALARTLETDLLYLDPPYNARQYGANYHLLETIARYDDPPIRGKAGLRDYSAQKSPFCSTRQAVGALHAAATLPRYRVLMLSYNSEGLMSDDQIRGVLEPLGDLRRVDIDYARFKSNSGGDAAHRRVIQEYVYVLTRH